MRTDYRPGSPFSGAEARRSPSRREVQPPANRREGRACVQPRPLGGERGPALVGSAPVVVFTSVPLGVPQGGLGPPCPNPPSLPPGRVNAALFAGPWTPATSSSAARRATFVACGEAWAEASGGLRAGRGRRRCGWPVWGTTDPTPPRWAGCW